MPPPTPIGLPPDAAAIEAIARAALDALPDAFRHHLDDVLLRVEEWPEEEMLDALGIEDAYELTGLYTGRPVGEKGVGDTGAPPDMIHLFRRPLLDEWAAGEDTLEALVAHVLIHEVGHHFGLSDDDMHALERTAE